MAAIDCVLTRQKLSTLTELLAHLQVLRVQANQLKCLNLFYIQQCASCWVVESSESHYNDSSYKVQESD